MDRQSERAKILTKLRSKLRGSVLGQSSNEELSFSEDQLVEQLEALQPKSLDRVYHSYDKFQFYWRHPAMRLFFVIALWCLDMYIFGEDPTTYSTTPCRIGGIGHIINLLHFTHGDTFPWILLRLFLLLIFLFAGLLFAKILKSRLALRFEMFTYKGSYFIITGAVLVIALAICAKVYNKIRWKILCNDYTADCSCEDVKCGGYLSNNLHIQNNTFANLTQCGAFIADTLAVFGVLDLSLQDDSVYRIGSSFNVSGFWERHRRKILWSGFALLMILGIPSIVFSTHALHAYQQKFSLGHRSNIGRMVVSAILFIVDLCIVTQDLDFPHFENSLEVKLLGTNIAFEGSFINYIMVLVSMLLDLNNLYTHGWYRPTDYGQFYLKNRRICNRQHTTEFTTEFWQVNCTSPRCPFVRFSKEEQDFWNGRDACEAENLLLGSRYHPEIKEWRICLVVVPIMAGIMLFCILFRLAGRSPQNLCKRVVISNAFAAKRVEESHSVQMTEITGVLRTASVPAKDAIGRGSRECRLLAKLDADGADGADGADVHRVIVVTAAGVTAFELRDNPRSPYGGIQGAWMSPHIFCTRLRFWLWRKMFSWQGSGSLELGSSSRDYLYARVQDLKEKLRTDGLIRTDVPFHSLELLWQGRLLHNETILRSLGADAILYLLYDRWSLRRKRLAAWRAEVFE